MATPRTKFSRADRPFFRAALANQDLGDLLFNHLSQQTGGDDVPVAFRAMGVAGAPGAIAGSGIVAREETFGNLHFTRLTLASRSVTMTDEAGVVAYGGTKLYDFPVGVIQIEGVSISLTVTKSGAGINADFDGDWSVGTATASNNATLTGTEADIIASTANTQASSGSFTIAKSAMQTITAITDNGGGATADGTIGAITLTEPANLAAQTVINNQLADAIKELSTKLNELIAGVVGTYSRSFDGTSTAKDLYLNFIIDDADQDGGGALLLTGTVDISWRNLGDV